MYSNAQYVNDPNGNPVCIRVDIDGITSLVPIDHANTDYQNIMRLVDAGELVIAPAEGAGQ
jgi:hypothetical protein